MWLMLAISSAFFFAIEFLCQKKLSTERGIYSAGWLILGVSLPFLIAAVFLFGNYLNLASLSWQFWWPLLIIWLVLYPIQTYFFVRSLKEGEFSSVIPLMSILPVFNIFVSWLLIGEVPSFVGVLGIVVICVSVFILLRPKDSHVFDFRRYSRAGLFMLMFCFCVAFGSTFDKISMQASEPIFYILMNSLGGTVVLGIIALFHKPRNAINTDISYIRNNLGFTALVGLTHAAGMTLFAFSLKTGLVSYILAIRSSSFVVAAFLGFLLYKERITKEKFVSLLLIIIGLVALSFA